MCVQGRILPFFKKMDLDFFSPWSQSKHIISACLQYTQNISEWRAVLYRAFQYIPKNELLPTSAIHWAPQEKT